MGDDQFLPSLHKVLLLVRESTFLTWICWHLSLLGDVWELCPVFCREAQYSW